jgi:hypothetical protein
MSLWDALRMNMMISYQELVRTFPSAPSVTAPFRAELSANPAETVVEGPFSKDVILKITYN